MNSGEYIELTAIALLFLVDLAALRWLTDRELQDEPPRLIRQYLFYRQHAISRYFPM